MVPDLSKKEIKRNVWRDPKPNDDKRKLNDGKKEVTDEPLWCQGIRALREPPGLTR
jgi:hypothetical protein